MVTFITVKSYLTSSQFISRENFMVYLFGKDSKMQNFSYHKDTHMLRTCMASCLNVGSGKKIMNKDSERQLEGKSAKCTLIHIQHDFEQLQITDRVCVHKSVSKNRSMAPTFFFTLSMLGRILFSLLHLHFCYKRLKAGFMLQIRQQLHFTPDICRSIALTLLISQHVSIDTLFRF